VGLTTVRFGAQRVSGDRAFHGNRESINPPPTADFTWHREVYSLEAYHQFSPKIGGGVVLPIYQQHLRNHASGIASDAEGIGDMSFYALWTPWETDAPAPPDSFFSARNVSIMLGMSIPTGDELEGEVPALHNYHLGSGSPEFKFSARDDGLLHPDVLLSGSTTMTVDGGPDSTGFRFGNGYDFSLGISWSAFSSVRFVASLDAVVREKDKLSSIRLPDTGGNWLFGILGVMFSPAKYWWVELSASIPMYWNVNGTQPVSNEVYSLGIRYTF
jgi:hypothetical protein